MEMETASTSAWALHVTMCNRSLHEDWRDVRHGHERRLRLCRHRCGHHHSCRCHHLRGGRRHGRRGGRLRRCRRGHRRRGAHLGGCGHRRGGGLRWGRRRHRRGRRRSQGWQIPWANRRQHRQRWQWRRRRWGRGWWRRRRLWHRRWGWRRRRGRIRHLCGPRRRSGRRERRYKWATSSTVAIAWAHHCGPLSHLGPRQECLHASSRCGPRSQSEQEPQHDMPQHPGMLTPG
mmetsp:Transcript_31577/g.75684  ORF Transcript_31577/g.75684 Transcript_31577/m.75684 type:complete len:232 (+) Transcript_31577:147-842(+)